MNVSRRCPRSELIEKAVRPDAPLQMKRRLLGEDVVGLLRVEKVS